MTKMLFRNVFFIFKSKVTNCGPQPTVLNISNFIYLPSFQLPLKTRWGWRFCTVSSQVVTGHGGHIPFPFPVSPQCPVLTHQPAPLVSTSAWPSLSFGFATPTLSFCDKTHRSSIERFLGYIPYSLQKLHNFSPSTTCDSSWGHFDISILPRSESYHRWAVSSSYAPRYVYYSFLPCASSLIIIDTRTLHIGISSLNHFPNDLPLLIQGKCFPCATLPPLCSRVCLTSAFLVASPEFGSWAYPLIHTTFLAKNTVGICEWASGTRRAGGRHWRMWPFSSVTICIE